MKDTKFQALELLSELESVTRSSLESYREKEAPQAALSAPEPTGLETDPATPAAAVPSKLLPGNYTSNNSDYKPALQDQDIIQALLKLRSKVVANAAVGMANSTRKKSNPPQPRATAVQPEDWAKLKKRRP